MYCLNVYKISLSRFLRASTFELCCCSLFSCVLSGFLIFPLLVLFEICVFACVVLRRDEIWVPDEINRVFWVSPLDPAGTLLLGEITLTLPLRTLCGFKLFYLAGLGGCTLSRFSLVLLPVFLGFGTLMPELSPYRRLCYPPVPELLPRTLVFDCLVCRSWAYV